MCTNKRRRKKIDKNKNVTKQFFTLSKLDKQKNTKAVMFINFAMCRCVCACKNKNIFSQEQ